MTDLDFDFQPWNAKMVEIFPVFGQKDKIGSVILHFYLFDKKKGYENKSAAKRWYSSDQIGKHDFLNLKGLFKSKLFKRIYL